MKPCQKSKTKRNQPFFGYNQRTQNTAKQKKLGEKKKEKKQRKKNEGFLFESTYKDFELRYAVLWLKKHGRKAFVIDEN